MCVCQGELQKCHPDVKTILCLPEIRCARVAINLRPDLQGAREESGHGESACTSKISTFTFPVRDKNEVSSGAHMHPAAPGCRSSKHQISITRTRLLAASLPHLL